MVGTFGVPIVSWVCLQLVPDGMQAYTLNDKLYKCCRSRAERYKQNYTKLYTVCSAAPDARRQRGGEACSGVQTSGELIHKLYSQRVGQTVGAASGCVGGVGCVAAAGWTYVGNVTFSDCIRRATARSGSGG